MAYESLGCLKQYALIMFLKENLMLARDYIIIGFRAKRDPDKLFISLSSFQRRS